jgi:catechol 2,3-dioxygenase-like lactoylglutathione lyase family enzyme
MKARINILTLGVDNLEQALKFYRDGMGLQTPGIVGKEFEHGAVVFFDLANGLKLALYERKNLAWDSALKRERSTPDAAEFSIGHLVNSKEEVDEVMEQAKKAGARVTKPAQKTFWGGYAGYFKDPDGHLWEVAWNPGWKIAE